MINNIISFCGKTDTGKNRNNNEDAFIAQSIWNDQVVLAAAIDGVGGYEGGEVAAAIARRTIIEYLDFYPNGERADLIKQAVVEANNAINRERIEDPERPNMSCVMTAAIVDTKNGYLHMAHIGDTRLYRYANGKIEKLSHDHSLVGYREEIGDLTEEEAMHHPERNVIGRDAGSQVLDFNTDLVETASFPLISNSTYVLCSDGLSDMLTSSMMIDILKGDMSLEERVDALINKANEEGGKDNITVVMIDYTGPTKIEEKAPAIEDQEIPNKESAIFSQENPDKESSQESSPTIVDINLKRIEILLYVVVFLLTVISIILGYFLFCGIDIMHNLL